MRISNTYISLTRTKFQLHNAVHRSNCQPTTKVFISLPATTRQVTNVHYRWSELHTMWPYPKKLYACVPDEGEDKQHEEANSPRTHCQELRRTNSWSPLSAVLSAVCLVLVLLLYLQAVHSDPGNARHCVYENDFDAAAPEVKYHKVEFGGIEVKDGSFSIVEGDRSRTYVGPPSREIDEAWGEILKERWFNITTKEKAKLYGAKGEQYLDFVQLDVFHLLHCINHLRKVIDAAHYHPDGLPPLRIHTGAADDHFGADHCLDVLRESIQCHSDLTPIPYRWFPNSQYYYSDSRQVHTCRDFGRVRQWLVEKRNPFEIEFFKWE
ncbi:hypothetical protein GE09DRAFT_757191 [Coniochaeta sp. 2T2.1]|nr:hypothetical protein GE09DRAFT_757191 [Coniochaeta sp. 2T2.1]